MDNTTGHEKGALTNRQHARQQEAIAALEQQALDDEAVDTLWDAVVGTASRTLEVSHGKILLTSPHDHALTLKAGVGWQDGWIGRHICGVGENTQNRHVLMSHEPVIVADFLMDTRFAPSELLRIHGIRSGVSVPILGIDGLTGVLSVFSRDAGRFNSAAARFLQTLVKVLVATIHRRQADEKLSYPSRFDALTGLPNRRLFIDRLGQAMELAKHRQARVGVVLADLDHFRIVNDAMGRGNGDKLLVQVAQRLQQCVRSGDTVARVGGDEFAFILSGMAQAKDATLVAEKVIAALSVPCELEGEEIYISASLGISVYPSDCTDVDGLLRNADAAMFQAKENGPAIYRFYLPQMNERAVARLKLETQLRGALARDEFVLYYQPRASLANGSITGFEALLRWQHPALGLMPPLQFISILEDTGLIVSVGEWIVLAACKQIMRWKSQGLMPHPISVNLSARQFQQRNLGFVIERTLRATGIDPALLEFELTESMLMKEAEAAIHALQVLKTFGVRVSMDDFGKGYSSLAYLKRFPLDVLKIDRAFIRDVAFDPDDATITVAMIKLAHSLGLKVVAEGVETRDQLDFLIENGCDEMQGYYFSRPLPLEGASRALMENHRLALH